jgi:hypothetical protein
MWWNVTEHALHFGMQVVQEVKDLVKEGEGGVAAVGGAISGAVAEFPGVALPNIPSGGEVSLSPALQAGIVAGAGAIGVLVASTVVNSLVSPAKWNVKLCVYWAPRLSFVSFLPL